MLDHNIVFVEEFSDILDSLESFLRETEDITTKESIFYLFRNIHTLKGNSQSIGHIQFGNYLHNLEDHLSFFLENIQVIDGPLIKEKFFAILSELYSLYEILKQNPDYKILDNDLKDLYNLTSF